MLAQQWQAQTLFYTGINCCKNQWQAQQWSRDMASHYFTQFRPVWQPPVCLPGSFDRPSGLPCSKQDTPVTLSRQLREISARFRSAWWIFFFSLLMTETRPTNCPVYASGVKISRCNSSQFLITTRLFTSFFWQTFGISWWKCDTLVTVSCQLH